jgi:hypothetical protein
VLSRLVDGIDQLPENIELELISGGVADAHRGGAMIAGKPGDLPFRQVPFSS